MINLAAITAAAALSAGIAGLYFGYDYGYGQAEAKVVQQERRDAEVVALAMQGAAEAISKIKLKNTTIKQEIQREIRTNTVYAECQHSPQQLQRINESLTGDRPEPAGPGIVPKADPPQ